MRAFKDEQELNKKFRNPSDEGKNDTILASDQIDAKNIKLNINLKKLNILNKLN